MAEPMQVTACRVFLNQIDDKHLKGFASIIFNDCFAVTDLKIIYGNRGLFVAMPSRRRRDGSFRDVAHPVSKDLRDHIEEVVLSHYRQLLDPREGPVRQTRDLSRPQTSL